jgi:hypothetical protein
VQSICSGELLSFVASAFFCLLDRYEFPALLLNRSDIEDATVGQFRGQRCNEYGEKIGEIRIFQMAFTEVHEIRARGAAADDDADVDDATNGTLALEPNPNALALALASAPRDIMTQIPYFGFGCCKAKNYPE